MSTFQSFETRNFSLLHLRVESKPHSTNQARNVGLAAARSPIVLFLDDDTLLPDGQFLERVLKLHLQNPQIFAIGGAYLAPQRLRSFYNWYCNVWLETFVLENTSEGQRTSMLLGGNFSIKRNVLQFRFKEEVNSNGDETPFFTDARKRNQSILLSPGHGVLHLPQESFQKYLKRMVSHSQSDYLSADTELHPQRLPWMKLISVKTLHWTLALTLTVTTIRVLRLIRQTIELTKSRWQVPRNVGQNGIDTNI